MKCLALQLRLHFCHISPELYCRTHCAPIPSKTWEIQGWGLQQDVTFRGPSDKLSQANVMAYNSIFGPAWEQLKLFLPSSSLSQNGGNNLLAWPLMSPWQDSWGAGGCRLLNCNCSCPAPLLPFIPCCSCNRGRSPGDGGAGKSLRSWSAAARGQDPLGGSWFHSKMIWIDLRGRSSDTSIPTAISGPVPNTRMPLHASGGGKAGATKGCWRGEGLTVQITHILLTSQNSNMFAVSIPKSLTLGWNIKRRERKHIWRFARLHFPSPSHDRLPAIFGHF